MEMDPREESSHCQSPSVKRKRHNSAAGIYVRSSTIATYNM